MISKPSYGNVSTVSVEGEPQGARNVNIKLGVKAVAGTPSSMLHFAPCKFCSCDLAEVAVSLPRSRSDCVGSRKLFNGASVLNVSTGGRSRTQLWIVALCISAFRCVKASLGEDSRHCGH